MKKVLELKNINVKYDDKTILKDISFDVDENSIFGYLGPSGAGKTTTIKLLTKQLLKESGSIQLFEKDLEEYPASIYDSLGILTDSNNIYEALSVEENINLFCDLRGTDRKEGISVLKELGLYEDRKKPAKSLSRGMRNRLLLGTAIIHRPKLLFLDEPTGSLDPKTTLEIHNILRRLQKEGTTIFLTTHSMEEAEKLCDYIAFIDHGQIVEQGKTEELKLKHGKEAIKAVFKNKGVKEYTKDEAGLQQIITDMKEDELIKLHSDESNIESIFLDITGRDTYENK